MKRARDAALRAPVFGLEEEKDGVVMGRGANGAGREGMVVEMEHRRRSGRAVYEMFWLPPPTSSSTTTSSGRIMLLDEHPLFTPPLPSKSSDLPDEDGDGGSTFNLGLTERQRQAREGVVLPFFDAQRGDKGEGGRILYEMGREDEDDFDEEEDEI